MSGRVGSITTDIIADGLVFNMDAANRASTIPSTSTDKTFNTVDTSISGSFINDIFYDSSTISPSLSFDGAADYITLPDITINNTSFTFSMWIKPIGSISLDMLITRQSSTGGRNGTLGLQSVSGTYCALLSYSHNSSTVKVQSNNLTKSSMLDVWSHVVLVRNGLTSTFYLNGTDIGGGTFGSSQPSTIDIDKIGYGFNNWYYEGKVANTHIYNRALSANEVLHNYNALKGRFGL